MYVGYRVIVLFHEGCVGWWWPLLSGFQGVRTTMALREEIACSSVNILGPFFSRRITLDEGSRVIIEVREMLRIFIDLHRAFEMLARTGPALS